MSSQDPSGPDEPGINPWVDDSPVRVRSSRKRSRWTRFKQWVKDHKPLAILLLILLLLISILLGWLWWLNRQIDDIDRFQLDLDRDNRPAKVQNDSVNILLLGLDDNDYLDDVGADMHELIDSGEWQRGAFRSDVMMVLHINSNRESAQLISVPRDSWVEVPGEGKNKINAALSLGGPTLAAKTVEDAFDIHLDHVMLIDFQGFRDLTEILDGIDVYVDSTVTDRDITWTEGKNTIQGEKALRFVRQRYGLPGGDFDRVHRQQAFLKSVLDKVASRGTLTNPVRVTKLVGQLSDLIAVDENFSNSELRNLAISSRGLRSSSIRFLTVPNLGTGQAGKASIVKLDLKKAREMFTEISKDRFEGWYAHNEIDEMAPGGVVR